MSISTSLPVLYGIKNCDTIKKARHWLKEQHIDYQFHDFRTDGITIDWLREVTQSVGWENSLNTRGTTWRKLPELQRQSITDEKSAIELMLHYPTIIKRPILIMNNRYLVGFNTDTYRHFFQKDA